MWTLFSYKGHKNKHVPGFSNLKKKLGQHTENHTIEIKEKNDIFFNPSPFLFRLHTKKSLWWCPSMSIPAGKSDEIINGTKCFDQINTFY